MRDRREAFLKTDPQVFRAACAQLAELDLRGELAKVKVPETLPAHAGVFANFTLA